MKIIEITSAKPTATQPMTQPKSADQLRLDGLKSKKDTAAQQVATERKRQQVSKAAQSLASAQRVQIATANTAQ